MTDIELYGKPTATSTWPHGYTRSVPPRARGWTRARQLMRRLAYALPARGLGAVVRMRRSLARLIRTICVACYVAAQTGSAIWRGLRYEWAHPRNRAATLPAFLSTAAKIVRYEVAEAVDPRTFFACDGDGTGRLRKDLNRAERRRRRSLADLRRRQAGRLLRSLGDTADEIEANLTRHWQIYGDDIVIELIGDYLFTRMRWRDHTIRWPIHINAWASRIGGVWVPTPKPVRRYLPRATEHEWQLEQAYTPHPQRGLRPAPATRPA